MKFLGKDPNIIDAYYTATADKALTAGNAVLVKSDGKITKPGSTLGSAITVISSNVNFVESVFDSTNNKVVVACTDEGNSNVGKAFVVSVSGTTCTAGSVVQFSSGGADNISITFDSANEKVVISYRDKNNTNYGTSVVGTVSGTSISFGTPVVFESANTSDIGSTFDSSNNKVVIGYRDVGNSGHGTARVGTVSSTSISFGSAVVFEAASTKECSLVFDSSNNKVVIAYEDAAIGDHGTGIVGTVSGTSISFGSPVVYTGTEVGYFPSGSFNPDTGKVGVFVYSTDADFYEATISGTSVSFSGLTEIDSDAPGGEHTVVYDTNADVYVFVYPDSGNSNYATVVALDPGPALTSENFIGFADDTYAENEQSTIAIVGCIDRNQTGLTAGQQYFVQGDGTLSTTADSPSVLAGTAISATELVVKE
jgi:hypothetical protein